MISRTKVVQNFSQKFDTCIFDSYAISVGPGVLHRVVDFLHGYCDEHTLSLRGEASVEAHFNQRYGHSTRGFQVVDADHTNGSEAVFADARAAVTVLDIPDVVATGIPHLEQILTDEAALLCVAEREPSAVHATVFGRDSEGFYRVDRRGASTAHSESGIVARANNKMLDGLLVKFRKTP